MGYKYFLPTEGTSAQRPASAPINWKYYETDTKRQLLWTGTAWLKTNGPTEELAIGGWVAGSEMPNGVVSTLVDISFLFPAGVYGPISIKADCMWTATNNAAAFVRVPVLQGGSIVLNAAEVRLHNHGSGYGVFQHLSVTGTALPPTPGISTTVRMEISVDPGGSPIFCYDNRIWIDW